MQQSLDKILRWLALGLPFPLIVLNGWLLLQVFSYFQSLVTIAITATLLAFVLDYPVRLLQHWGLARGRAVLLVVVLTLFSVLGIGITLVPFLLEQLDALLDLLPTWLDSGQRQLRGLEQALGGRRLPFSLRDLDAQFKQGLPEQLDTITTQVVELALGTVSNVSELVFTIVIGFYLLLDGESLWQRLLHWLPASLSQKVQTSLRQKFQSYFVGQVTVAIIMGIMMTLGFLILHVPFPFLFGLSIGLITLFPFGDLVGYGVVSVLMGFQDFWLGVKVLVLAILIDQVVDSIISPRVLGGFTGLRPLWILLALLVGASLGGILGLFIAVPIASFLNALWTETETVAEAAVNEVQQLVTPSTPAQATK